jgi:hypothetical protein
MPTITFSVNLETVNQRAASQPYKATEAANFKLTRSTWLPDLLRDNRKLKHGDTVTVSGLQALYLKNNFTSGDFKCLDIVSES